MTDREPRCPHRSEADCRDPNRAKYTDTPCPCPAHEPCNKPMSHNQLTCEWRCPAGHAPMSEEYAALHRLGPYAPHRPPEVPVPDPIPGYVWTGTHYERLGEPDFKKVWQDGLRAVASLRRKGEW